MYTWNQEISINWPAALNYWYKPFKSKLAELLAFFFSFSPVHPRWLQSGKRCFIFSWPIGKSLCNIDLVISQGSIHSIVDVTHFFFTLWNVSDDFLCFEIIIIIHLCCWRSVGTSCFVMPNTLGLHGKRANIFIFPIFLKLFWTLELAEILFPCYY